MTTAAMASGLDRLERLFSGRKNKDAATTRPPRSSMLIPHRKSLLFSPSSNTASMTSSPSAPHLFSTTPTHSSLDDLHFPLPSFIRPKASRMQPRDDFTPTGATIQRKNSALITSTSHTRLAAPTSPLSTRKNSNGGSPVAIRPPRSPLLPLTPPHSDSTAATVATSIPPAIQNAQPAPSKAQQASLQLQQQLDQTTEAASPPLHEETEARAVSADSLHSTAVSTVATEPFESNSSLARSSSQATLVPSRGPASPKADTEPKTPMEVTAEATAAEPTKTPVQRRSSVVSAIALPPKSAAQETCPASTFYFRSNFTAQRRRVRVARRPLSLRYQRHLPATPRPSLSLGAVLLEPNVGDFLALSDDDIAEEATAGTKAEEAKPAPATTVAKTVKTAKANAKLQKPLPPLPSKTTVPSSSPAAAAPVSRSAPTTLTSSRFRLNENSPAAWSSASVRPVSPAPPLTPLGTRPQTPIGHTRMTAAFEMARIASKHNLDLAYIARIWPKRRSAGPPSAGGHKSQSSSVSSSSYNSTTSLCSSNASASTDVTAVSAGRRPSTASSISTASSASSLSVASGSRSPRLAAQFLAAYGLATVAAPYSLSAPMHSKILRAKDHQWLSFHEPEAKKGEFFRGYGCAFFDGSDEADEADVVNGNSGLVFVAYQRRAADGKDDVAVLPAAALDELRRAVAALVGQLLAVHPQQAQQAQAQQLAKAAAARGHTDVMCTLRRSQFLGVRAKA